MFTKPFVHAVLCLFVAGCMTGDDAKPELDESSSEVDADPAAAVAPARCTVSPATTLANVQDAVTDCATVWFRNGTYTLGAEIAVTKQTTLQPLKTAGASVTFDGQGSVTRGFWVRTAGADGTVIRGMRFTNYKFQGILVSGPNVTITGNTFTDNREHGLAGNYANGLSVTYNTFKRNGELTDKGRGAGFKITRSADFEVAHNNASENNGSGLWTDISCARFNIHDNVADSNKTYVVNGVAGGGGNGIFIELSGDATVRDNRTSNNETSGITIHGSPNSVIEDNVALNNGFANLLISESGRTFAAGDNVNNLVPRVTNTVVRRNDLHCATKYSLYFQLSNAAVTTTMAQTFTLFNRDIYSTSDTAVRITIHGVADSGGLALVQDRGFEANGATAACP